MLTSVCPQYISISPQQPCTPPPRQSRREQSFYGLHERAISDLDALLLPATPVAQTHSLLKISTTQSPRGAAFGLSPKTSASARGVLQEVRVGSTEIKEKLRSQMEKIDLAALMNKAVLSSRSPQKRLTSVLDMSSVRAVGGTGHGGTGARNVHHLWAESLVSKERETERREEANEEAAQEEEDWQSAGAACISFTGTSKASSVSTTSPVGGILGRYLGDSVEEAFKLEDHEHTERISKGFGRADDVENSGKTSQIVPLFKAGREQGVYHLREIWQARQYRSENKYGGGGGGGGEEVR